MARIAGFIKEKKYNIAKPEWLERALGSDKPLTHLIDFTRDDMLFATESLAQQFDNLDLYGEGNTQPKAAE